MPTYRLRAADGRFPANLGSLEANDTAEAVGLSVIRLEARDLQLWDEDRLVARIGRDGRSAIVAPPAAGQAPAGDPSIFDAAYALARAGDCRTYDEVERRLIDIGWGDQLARLRRSGLFRDIDRQCRRRIKTAR